MRLDPNVTCPLFPRLAHGYFHSWPPLRTYPTDFLTSDPCLRSAQGVPDLWNVGRIWDRTDMLPDHQRPPESFLRTTVAIHWVYEPARGDHRRCVRSVPSVRDEGVSVAPRSDRHRPGDRGLAVDSCPSVPEILFGAVASDHTGGPVPYRHATAGRLEAGSLPSNPRSADFYL